MSTPLDVSVVVSNYNTRARLEACLRSLLPDLEQSGLRFEVIVVDDASTDGSTDMVAAQFPSVTLCSTGENCGYAKANNLGMRTSSGPTVLLLNSDTIVQPGAVASLHRALTTAPDLAAVGPTLLNEDGSVQRSCWRFPMASLVGNTLLLFTLGLWDDYRTWTHRRDREVDWMSSAALLVRRSALDAVGLFDEAFWVYGVDIDWALRAHRLGFRCLTVSEARIVHYGRSSWGTMGGRMRRDHMRSQDRLFRKHYGPTGWAFYRTAVFCNCAIRVAVWGVPCALGNRRLAPKVAFFVENARWAVLGDRGWTTREAARDTRGFELPL